MATVRTPIRNVTPYLTFDDAATAADFYARAFGAQQTFAREDDTGGVAHMAMTIGDGIINLADSPCWGRWEYGDRSARVRDPFGQVWSLSSPGPEE